MPPLYVQHTYALLCSHMSMRNCLNVKNKIKWNQDPHVVLQNSIKNTECERSKHLQLEFDVYTKIIEATISSGRTELSSSNSRKLTNRLFMVSLTLSLAYSRHLFSIFSFFACVIHAQTFFLLFMVVWRNHEKHYAKSERTSEVTSYQVNPKKEQLLVGCVCACVRETERAGNTTLEMCTLWKFKNGNSEKTHSTTIKPERALKQKPADHCKIHEIGRHSDSIHLTAICRVVE